MDSTVIFFVVGLCVCSRGTGAITELHELKDYKDHPCVRPCTEGDEPRVCRYDWTLELYYTLSKACGDCPFNHTHCSLPHCVAADGTSRGILTANRLLPGPEIQVCEGDEIVVNVVNYMETATGTSIHWHGLLQTGSPHMDGVSLITQCPINQLSTFQYRFMAMDPGTHWWHSHAGLQRSDGLFGHLVIRQKPSRDPHSVLYDYDLPEHVMSVTDWLVEMTENRFAAHHHDDGDNKPASMLINGKGAFQPFKDPQTNETVYTPYAEFKVNPAQRYRFRVISTAILNCPIQFSIDNHTLMVIASDGGDFDPIVVDSFNIFAGERYDFVLTALNTSQPANHWIRVRGLADCNVKKAHQLAVLRYEGAPPGLPKLDRSYEAGVRPGLQLNPWNTKGTDMLIPVDRLNSTSDVEDDDTLKETPDKKFYLAMDFNKIDNFHFNVPGLYPLSAVTHNKRLYSPQLNHISFILPPVPLLTQFHQMDEEEQFCTSQTVQVNCDTQYCECTHRLKVSLGDVVEFVIIDEGVTFDANHPMHMHGYKYRVIGLDRLNKSTSLEEVKELDRKGLLKRKLSKAPRKDTVTVPDGGYTIIRIKADNPGVWLLHCHIEFHSAIGMVVVIQVGEDSDFPIAPKGFPTCGSWILNDDNNSNNNRNNNHNSNNNNNNPNSCTNGASRVCGRVLFFFWVIVFGCVRDRL